MHWWSYKLLCCKNHYYLFNSLWLTLQIFLSECYKKTHDDKQRSYFTTIAFHLQIIQICGVGGNSPGLPTWMNGSPLRYRTVSGQVQRCAAPPMAGNCQHMCSSKQCSKSPFMPAAKRHVCEKEALRLREKMYLCQVRMLLLQTFCPCRSVYMPPTILFYFFNVSKGQKPCFQLQFSACCLFPVTWLHRFLPFLVD